MTRKKLYIILSLALIPGYLLLLYEFNSAGRNSLPDLCLFKQITGLQCPSCGSTRSVVSLMHGDLSHAIFYNPLGLVISAIMLSAPFWLAFDCVTRKKTLFEFYCRAEVFLRKPQVAGILICLILANWVWNITKGL